MLNSTGELALLTVSLSLQFDSFQKHNKCLGKCCEIEQSPIFDLLGVSVLRNRL